MSEAPRSYCGNSECAEQPEILPEDFSVPTSERRRCPACGSRARRYDVGAGRAVIELTATARAVSSATATAHVEIVASTSAHAEVVRATGEASTPEVRLITAADYAYAQDEVSVLRVDADVVEDRVTLHPDRHIVMPGLVADEEYSVRLVYFPDRDGVAIVAVYSSFGGLIGTVPGESPDAAIDAIPRLLREHRSQS